MGTDTGVTASGVRTSSAARSSDAAGCTVGGPHVPQGFARGSYGPTSTDHQVYPGNSSYMYRSPAFIGNPGTHQAGAYGQNYTEQSVDFSQQGGWSGADQDDGQGHMAAHTFIKSLYPGYEPRDELIACIISYTRRAVSQRNDLLYTIDH